PRRKRWGRFGMEMAYRSNEIRWCHKKKGKLLLCLHGIQAGQAMLMHTLQCWQRQGLADAILFCRQLQCLNSTQQPFFNADSRCETRGGNIHGSLGFRLFNIIPTNLTRCACDALSLECEEAESRCSVQTRTAYRCLMCFPVAISLPDSLSAEFAVSGRPSTCQLDNLGVDEQRAATAAGRMYLRQRKIGMAAAFKICKKEMYGVYDIEYELESKQKRNKLVFVSWGPDNLPIRQRDAHRLLQERSASASCREVHKEMQASELGEITEDCMIETPEPSDDWQICVVACRIVQDYIHVRGAPGERISARRRQLRSAMELDILSEFPVLISHADYGGVQLRDGFLWSIGAVMTG
uniref:ADF-H domain-containing protein n=1 Tax=Macrostomum lignano TaxID=282301 RepID=A0A1I8FJ53_9PLAT